MKKINILFSILILSSVSIHAQDKIQSTSGINPSERQKTVASSQKEAVNNNNTTSEKTKNPTIVENAVPAKKEESNTGERKKSGNP